MSMYKCRKCNGTGHLNDAYVGYYDEQGLCFRCYKVVTQEELVAIFKDIDERKDKWESTRKLPKSTCPG